MKKVKCGCYFEKGVLNIVCDEHTYYELYGDYNGITESLVKELLP